ncbi:MAG: DUF6765 family protein [bacterium]
MEVDFHHAVIYTLCRLAGMDSKYAEIVAYASQQVDDATFGHALNFKNGGVFKQTRTGHQGLSRKLVDISDAFEVWIPFHFLPGGEGESILQRLITRPEGKAIHLLKEDILATAREPYGLHRLGIGLHLYADAYSHQDFVGFYNSYNEIDLLKALEKKSLLKKIIDWLMRKLSFLAPVGHGQALKNPDIPYVNWSYRRKNGQIIEVNNLQDRFSPAIDNIYNYIYLFLKENPGYISVLPVEDLTIYKEKILEFLSKRVGTFERHALFLEAIHNNYFKLKDFNDIDRYLSYSPRAWFEEAVIYLKATKLTEKLENTYANFYTFRQKDCFAESNWVMFMRAAAIHKYRVIHKILPACDLNLG